MANNIFGGLGGIMKGLSGLMPQDDPDAKLLRAQTDIDELEEQENALYAQIGRQAFTQDSSAWPQADALRLVQMNLRDARTKRDALELEKQAADKARESARMACACPACGFQNQEGIKFCQECGARLGAPRCTACGTTLSPGTRFCGECGAKQGE